MEINKSKSDAIEIDVYFALDPEFFISIKYPEAQFTIISFNLDIW